MNSNYILDPCFAYKRSLTNSAILMIEFLIQGVAGASICYLGYITGLFIVGVLGILIMWMFGGFWMAGVVLLGGGLRSFCPPPLSSTLSLFLSHSLSSVSVCFFSLFS